MIEVIHMTAILTLVILILSVVAHEIAHGYAAKWEGDETADAAGRLSGNPMRHIDPFGSVILPLITYMVGGFVIGWAKPVPINPRNFRHVRWGEPLVAAAGPLTNILFALIFGLIIRFASLGNASLTVAALIVLINVVLAIFNLLPIPPMDGSRILSGVFPNLLRPLFHQIERFGIFLPLILAIFIWQYIFPIALFMASSIAGVAF